MVPPERATEGILGLAAHEVKTAATSVRGYAQLLLRQLDRTGSVDTDRLHRAMRTIDQQAEHIGRIMDQLMDVGRIDAGTFTLRRLPVDLTHLLRDALQAPRRRAGRHELRLDLPDEPLVADVDAHRLRDVLSSLLDNALKFGPPTTPIDVVLRPQPAGKASITVTDRGPGVPVEHRDRLFQRFFQLHGAGFQAGIGLGLYLSREIARRHGGDLTAVFPDGGGASFTVTLPLAAGA